ncbi:hypothetical protein LOTGIDRAFT_158373 [Lottia gigantea]|uniref:Methyltransferase type 11 domain-containing protein n=1 Tax=Lottia gigantea TaxID=225164 RepID=V4A5T1_LOTGI|nr:hypothetical protein LOTGIDRAFT_158373 [Lottia gigantea]ESO99293.1 hypothetical protein LOTGIDRAFT_158373 [Lottia gigantea]
MGDLSTDSFSLKTAFEERKQMKRDEVINAFDQWAKDGKYEKDMSFIGNKGVDIVTRAASDHFSTNKDVVSVIDIAAGTGLASQALLKLGFSIIDGIDPSQGMKDEAMKKNIYRDYVVDFVDGHKTVLETDKYDCSVVSGGFSQSLMPCNALYEIVRIVKPGGVICIEMIESNLVRVEEFVNRLEPLWNTFIEKGVWKLLRKEKIPDLVIGETGLLMVFEVLVSEVPIPQLPPLNNNERTT